MRWNASDDDSRKRNFRANPKRWQDRRCAVLIAVGCQDEKRKSDSSYHWRNDEAEYGFHL
jgi:hypothetical protein